MPVSAQEITVDRLLFGDPELNRGIFHGTGTPVSNVQAAAGSIYLNTAGGTGATVWIKTSGSATSVGGWVALPQ